jgi:P-type Cu+ transporter
MVEDNKIPITENIDEKLSVFERDGKTAILVVIDNTLTGIIAISDTIKEGAKVAVKALRSKGIEVITMTRDNERTANAVASKLEIDRVIAQVLPHQKEEIISKLKTDEKKFVIMVGEGINDASALA